MDDRPTSPATQERSVNTTLHLSNGASLRRSSSSRPSSTTPDGSILNSHAYSFHHYTTLTIIKDSKGYGMKVSGDNPVYVQSVKDGGAAEKAGLHSGDKILKVNGADVTHSTHTEVVELIKSCVEVELTVQQRISHTTRPPMSSQTSLTSSSLNRCSSPSSTPGSPNSPTSTVTAAGTATSSSSLPGVQRPLHHHHSAPARDRITAPQPVDHEKLRQFESQRVQTFRLMLEKEQRYADTLRSELAKCSDATNEQQISRDLSGAKRRISTIQEQLQAMTANNSCAPSAQTANNSLLDGQLFSTPPPPPPLSTLPTRMNQHPPSSFSPSPSNPLFNNSLYNAADSPPPLPLRNRSITSPVLGTPADGVSPPPLPPRQYPLSPVGNVDDDLDTINASFTTDECGSTGSPLPIHHQRTKSNPDRINNANVSLPADVKSGERLASSESLTDLSSVRRSKSGISWKVESPFLCTPPGTPPPPYRGNTPHQKENLTPSPPVPPPPDDVHDGHREEDVVSHDLFSPNNTLGVENVSSQTTIISMEDDDMFDQDTSHLKDHGPFKSLSKLWKHNAHLAVFLNYVLSNCDPSSILFYLITDLYKEGNGKEMRKWAYEIHSSFLVPGAPLRLNKVDENIAREIDDVLLNESDKEEILRKVFWKARSKAKEELNDQLTDFQQKRGAGLGAIFGATDTLLDECIHDKSKELITVEQILVPRLKEFIIEDTDKEVIDDRKFTTAAALGTILSKIFGLRGQSFNSLLERCPTFVSKEKSFKARLIGRSRKVNVRGHNFVAHQYFTVTYCNHCQLIIRGIGPQGYQCTNCLLNIHRPCVKILEENCPGPLMKKEKTNDRITKLFMDRIRPERDVRRKPSTPTSQIERIRRQAEEQEGSSTDNEIGEKSANSKNSHRSSSVVNSFIDSLRETEEKQSNKQFSQQENNFLSDFDYARNPSQRLKSAATSINRSESYKERIHSKKQRERRKTSDPNLSKTTADVEIDNNAQFPYPSTNSGSSSNSNLSSRSLDSPSNSLEVVGSNNRGSCENTPSVPFNFNSNANNVANKSSTWDSESDTEPDPPELFKNLSPTEKKRQEVINELFQTERSHIRVLRVLDQLFYQPMKEQQILPTDYLQLLFPNLEEIFVIHSQLNSNLKSRKKENSIVGDVGDILLKTFDGVEGKNFENAAAVFCCRQKVALEMFKEKRSKKDSPLHNFLKEAESNPMCRRLQLQDIIPTEMQRLTKYPLLFENLAKYSRSNPKEEKSLLRAIERSKEIVNRIDEAIKEAADEDLMADIQKRLDKSAFDKIEHPMCSDVKNLDLTKRKLVHQGNLNLRITNKQKLIELYVLLLEDLIILLQKSHEKYLLQFFPSGGPNERGMCPVIKVSSNIIVRRNAVDKKALYLLDQAPHANQMYDFVAPSAHESKEWLDRLSNAADAHKSKDQKHKNDRSSDVSNVSAQDLDSCENGPESNSKTKDNDSHNSNENPSVLGNARQSSDELTPQGSESAAKKTSGGGSGGTSPGLRKKRILSAEPPRLTTEVPLIEPSQVLVSQRPVLTAEPVLTPLERLRRKDDVIKEALLEKQKLVADILHVPKEEFDTAADLVAEPVYDKEASELVLAAVRRVDHLTTILNECLRVTEEDVIAASCEVNATSKSSASSAGSGNGSGSGSGGSSVRTFPAVPVPRLQSITHSLSAHLTQLLTLMTERDEEREKLRQELQRSREKLHAIYETQQLNQCLDDQSSFSSANESVRSTSNDNQEDETKNTEASSSPETNNCT